MNPTPHPTPAARPSLLLLGSEPWRAAGDLLKFTSSRRLHHPPGDGHPVIIFPGLASSGRAVTLLRRHCSRLGYAAFDWGRGFNTGPRGDLDAWLEALADDVQRLLAGQRRTPTLIGWSLGGIYARELAKLPRLRVRQVITLGTPFNGLPHQTHAAWVYRLLSGTPPTLDDTLHQRLRSPPPVPTTSIYSRRDGIVPWQACRHDREGPQLQDIEVRASHLGMGWNPHVLQVVADRLAQPGRKWQRYPACDPAPGRGQVRGRRHAPCRSPQG